METLAGVWRRLFGVILTETVSDNSRAGMAERRVRQRPASVSITFNRICRGLTTRRRLHGNRTHFTLDAHITVRNS